MGGEVALLHQGRDGAVVVAIVRLSVRENKGFLRCYPFMALPSFHTQLQASAPRLVALLERFTQARVLVVGDLTLDEFLTGQVERISREAPVLIIRHETTRQMPGGGANAVYNLATLGAQVKAVGLVGKDDQGKALRGIFEDAGIVTEGIMVDTQRPTVTKTRISGHARQSVT